MPGCSAPLCHNSNKRTGIKFYRFPTDLQRCKQWVKNCKRLDWQPTSNHRLCSVHFEENQFEQRRADGRKLLMPFAVPTIFKVPDNRPRLVIVTRESVYENPCEEVATMSELFTNAREKFDSEVQRTAKIESENNKLKKENDRLKNQVVALETQLKYLKHSRAALVKAIQSCKR